MTRRKGGSMSGAGSTRDHARDEPSLEARSRVSDDDELVINSEEGELEEEVGEEEEEEETEMEVPHDSKPPPTRQQRTTNSTGPKMQGYAESYPQRMHFEFEQPYSDSADEDEVWQKMDSSLPSQLAKYRGIVAAYLENSRVYDVSVHGALQRIMDITGYNFDEEEKEDLILLIRGMFVVHFSKIDKAGMDPDKHVGDPQVLWYSSGLKERDKMRVRLKELRRLRLENEDKKRAKKDKKNKKRGREDKNMKPTRTIRDETADSQRPLKYADNLINGYTDSFEGVEFYYPAADDLSDSEILETSPVPDPGAMLTEEMNIVEMIRDTYKVSVAELRHVMGSEGDLKHVFQGWIAAARAKWASLDLTVDLVKDQDANLRLDPERINNDETLGQLKSKHKSVTNERQYILDRVLFSIPTPDRTASLLRFERDWGIAKASTHNYMLSSRTWWGRPRDIKPIPVYLVDEYLDDAPDVDPYLDEMFDADGDQDFDVDPKDSDPFETRLYGLSKPLQELLGHSLLRHRDVIFDIFRHVRRMTKPSNQVKYFMGDSFQIFSDRLQRVFFRKKRFEYITWKKASAFLFKHHYTIPSGLPIRPVDPLFYAENAHRNYAELTPYNELHKVMTFNAVASTGEVWRRHAHPLYGFRDSREWEHGFRKWAGAELQAEHGSNKSVDDQRRAIFKQHFDTLMHLERQGQVPEWWCEDESEMRDLPVLRNRPLVQLRADKESEYGTRVDRMRSIYQPTWYGEWRRPWQRNLGYTPPEMRAELAVLQDIAEEQQEEPVDTQDGWLRLRESYWLESDFLPPMFNKPFKANRSWHCLAPGPYNLDPPARKRPSDINGLHPWDQTLFGTTIANEFDGGMEQPRKRRRYRRALWWHPDRRRELDNYHFENLYGSEKWASDTLKVQDPKQVYLCDSEDEEDWLEETYAPLIEELNGRSRNKTTFDERPAQETPEPVVEEVESDDGPKKEGQDQDGDVEMGYDFGPTIEEVE
ncbi:hypothetical protein B0I73DRAFT_130233 [Yarrowia lipolytica]|uniref:Uncharacterized protein n=1 Tax=Yarrowia lipolytica TaxID=4952 RepID=A0A371C9E6_YARLL|nr:hypothetical protein B0I71DRAFT_130021 [Yarrowia lipolytica]RDW40476.1 hypothetical protein B0I73DRAFT_130233 [Yarrowia lipolytica]RDW47693.1 hypothetical protein B0I74DRAFT_134814 [Yarrowia lipolytica]RDW53913.1 hypothetical protein B0I75DRAFT_135498 [Yarrowia lipolytica]